MKDISFHILDIVQNSLHAGADKILIEMKENTKEGKLKLTISDNGSGMDPRMVDHGYGSVFHVINHKKSRVRPSSA